MSTPVSLHPIAASSPRVLARTTGVFYLLTIVGGVFAQMFVSDRLVVSGDAAATAANILANESLFRLGFTVYLIEMACQITMTVLLYFLLKPVSKRIALLAAVFSLVGCTVKTLSRLFFVAPLLILGGATYLTVFSTEQLQALALLFLKVNDQAAGMALAFFGFETLLSGYLTFRSTFLPRFLGVLGMLGGLGWVTFLSPPLGNRLLPAILAVGLLGAVSTVLWLLVVGVNEQRWNELASASGANSASR